MQLYELCCDMLDLATDISTIYGRPGSQFDQQAGSLVRLSNETVLYLREVGQDLALVCIIRMDNFKNHGSYKRYDMILSSTIVYEPEASVLYF